MTKLQRDIDFPARHEVANLLAERVLVGDRCHVEREAGRFEFRDHLKYCDKSGPVEEEHVQLGCHMGFGRFLERPGPCGRPDNLE